MNKITACKQIIVTFCPRSQKFVWAHYPPPGGIPSWQDGRHTLEATKAQIASTHPKAVFTVQNA